MVSGTLSKTDAKKSLKTVEAEVSEEVNVSPSYSTVCVSTECLYKLLACNDAMQVLAVSCHLILRAAESDFHPCRT